MKTKCSELSAVILFLQTCFLCLGHFEVPLHLRHEGTQGVSLILPKLLVAMHMLALLGRMQIHSLKLTEAVVLNAGRLILERGKLLVLQSSVEEALVSTEVRTDHEVLRQCFVLGLRDVGMVHLAVLCELVGVRVDAIRAVLLLCE